MKTRFTIFVLFFSCVFYLVSTAQSYYYIQNKGTEAGYSYTTLGDTLNGWPKGMPDTLTKLRTLPFVWQFYGEDVTGFKISDNGYITFDASETKSNPNNEGLPSATAPKKAIFAFWDNLVLYKPDSYSYLVHTWTYGTAPNRVFVIAWFQASKEPAGTTGTRMTFGIRLFESGLKSFDIVFDNHYNAGVAAKTDGTIGCQNAGGTDGTMVNGSPNYSFPTNITSSTADNVVFEFYYGKQLSFDLTMNSLNLPSFAKIGASVPISGEIRNLGSSTITSFKLNYSVNGSAAITQNISPVSIAPGTSYVFTHSTNWVVPNEEKDYIIEVWASDLNGNTDENPMNDKKSATITSLSNLVPRKPLYEVFTSSTCGPCKFGNENLKAVLDQNVDKWTCVKYQYNFPGYGDPYYTTEGQARGTFYGGINSVPRLEVDGGWNNNPGTFTNALFNQFAQNPCFVKINANTTVNGKTISVSGSATSYANINAPVKMFIAVVEKTTSKNIQSNGETEFHYVMKKMLPDANGTTINNIKKDIEIPINQTFTFPGSYKLPANATVPINLATEHSVEEFTDLAVVIWLQNTTTKEIYQSEFANLVNDIDEEPIADFKVNLYPNPVNTTGKIQFHLDNPTFVTFDITNSIGQRVYSGKSELFETGIQTLDFDANTLLKGVYYMNLYLGDKVITRTFVK